MLSTKKNPSFFLCERVLSSIVSKFLMQQMPQAAPAVRSGVEEPMFNPMESAPSNDFIQDSSLEMPANSTQGYVQQTPISDNQLMNSFNADSQAALVQPQPQGKAGTVAISTVRYKGVH